MLPHHSARTAPGDCREAKLKIDGDNTSVPPADTVPDPGQSSAPPPALRVLRGFDVGPLAEVKPFSIRNGAVTDAHSLLIRPTIPAEYHWQAIDGLRPEDAIKNTSAFISQTYTMLKSHDKANTNDELMKKRATVIGVARAVTTCLYTVTPNDIVPGELAPSYLRADYDNNGALTISIKPDVSAANRTLLQAQWPPSDAQTHAIAAAHMSAIGLLPLQGYSLIVTGHHYLSEDDNQSRRAYAVVERQFWKNSKANTWWTTDETTLQDCLWHKACHPVHINVKREKAQSERVAQMLRTLGAGSAAARLPAMETEMRKANSFRKLLSTVKPLFEMYGGSLNMDKLNEAIDIVNCYSADRLVVNPHPQLPPGTPPSVNSRTTALEYLTDVLNRNADTVAYAYGFYCALTEQSAISGGGVAADTLMSSYSLRGLRSQRLASYVLGTQAYSDYAAARNKERMEGRF